MESWCGINRNKINMDSGVVWTTKWRVERKRIKYE